MGFLVMNRSFWKSLRKLSSSSSLPPSQTPLWGTQAEGLPVMGARSQHGTKTASSSSAALQPPTFCFDPAQTGPGAPCLFLSLGLSQGWNVGGLCGLGLPTLSEHRTF